MLKPYRIFLLLLLLLCAPGLPAAAQHQHPPPPPAPPAEHQHPAPAPPQHQHEAAEKPAPQPEHQHEPQQQPAPAHQHPVGEHESETHQAEAHEAPSSGTAFLPASTPGHMWMRQAGAWQLMAHGNAFLTFNRQSGPRGDRSAESMNWLMFMQERPLGAARLELRQMLSFEPWTQRRGGFAQLFQAGETYQGQFLVDRQHPHDLFGELAARLSVPLGERVSWFLYGGAVGEPALGPVAFMHRASGYELPAAPLAHHLQDSTHVAFGVITTGLDLGPFRVEGSLFNGREPDERRWDFDFAPLASWSARLAFRPARDWALQYSYGYLNEPEAHEPGDIRRQTASLTYNRRLARGNWATSIIYGTNFVEHDQHRQHSVLVESTVNFRTRNYVFTRIEMLDREELFAHDPAPPVHELRLGAFTFGGVRDLVHNEHLQLGLGAALTLHSKPAALDALYGRHPTGFRIFLRLRPGLGRH